jgi:hypothetical protein
MDPRNRGHLLIESAAPALSKPKNPPSSPSNHSTVSTTTVTTTTTTTSVIVSSNSAGESNGAAAQDLSKKDSKTNSGQTRVALWDVARGMKLSGFACPMEKNLKKYLAEHPHCVPYDPKNIKQLQQQSIQWSNKLNHAAMGMKQPMIHAFELATALPHPTNINVAKHSTPAFIHRCTESHSSDADCNSAVSSLNSPSTFHSSNATKAAEKCSLPCCVPVSASKPPNIALATLATVVYGAQAGGNQRNSGSLGSPRHYGYNTQANSIYPSQIAQHHKYSGGSMPSVAVNTGLSTPGTQLNSPVIAQFANLAVSNAFSFNSSGAASSHSSRQPSPTIPSSHLRPNSARSSFSAKSSSLLIPTLTPLQLREKHEEEMKILREVQEKELQQLQTQIYPLNEEGISEVRALEGKFGPEISPENSFFLETSVIEAYNAVHDHQPYYSDIFNPEQLNLPFTRNDSEDSKVKIEFDLPGLALPFDEQSLSNIHNSASNNSHHTHDSSNLSNFNGESRNNPQDHVSFDGVKAEKALQAVSMTNLTGNALSNNGTRPKRAPSHHDPEHPKLEYQSKQNSLDFSNDPSLLSAILQPEDDLIQSKKHNNNNNNQLYNDQKDNIELFMNSNISNFSQELSSFDHQDTNQYIMDY